MKRLHWTGYSTENIGSPAYDPGPEINGRPTSLPECLGEVSRNLAALLQDQLAVHHLIHPLKPCRDQPVTQVLLRGTGRPCDLHGGPMKTFPTGIKDPVGGRGNSGQSGRGQPKVEVPIKLFIVYRERPLDP